MRIDRSSPVSETLPADEEALADFIYETHNYTDCKEKAKLLWPLLRASQPATPTGGEDLVNDIASRSPGVSKQVIRNLLAASEHSEDASCSADTITPDFDTAAFALGFRKFENGKWYSPTPSVSMNTAGTWETAEQIFEWWGRANGAAQPSTEDK